MSNFIYFSSILLDKIKTLSIVLGLVTVVFQVCRSQRRNALACSRRATRLTSGKLRLSWETSTERECGDDSRPEKEHVDMEYPSCGEDAGIWRRVREAVGLPCGPRTPPPPPCPALLPYPLLCCSPWPCCACSGAKSPAGQTDSAYSGPICVQVNLAGENQVTQLARV